MNFRFVTFLIVVSAAGFVVGDTSDEMLDAADTQAIDCSTGKYHPHETYCD